MKDEYGYSCTPRKFTEFAWFYEQRDGLEVLMRQLPNSRPTIESATIPWCKLEAAVDRHRKLKSRKRK